MPRKRESMVETLQKGRSYTWTVPDGGDLASMRKAIKYGQTLTMSPVADPSEIQVGDLVLVRWHKGLIFHIVGNIEGGQFLIVNSLGKVNGWVGAPDILGRVTRIVEPEPRPDVPLMLDELDAAYRDLIRAEQPGEDQIQRFRSIVDDLRWYAGRIGAERWDEMPRSNIWSFQQNLWQIIKEVRGWAAPVPDRVHYLIDRGKRCVGWASEILALFEYDDVE